MRHLPLLGALRYDCPLTDDFLVSLFVQSTLTIPCISVSMYEDLLSVAEVDWPCLD